MPVAAAGPWANAGAAAASSIASNSANANTVVEAVLLATACQA
jgi:hypothetical protein